LELERIKTKNIKVIGVSKVNIPTIFHPKVPYFVLLLEDERGNKWIQKSIKEYKIGEEFKIEKSNEKNSVAIWKIHYDILEGIEKSIELLAAPQQLFNAESKILILPGLFEVSHPYFRDNTSPEFLEAVLEFLFEKGVRSENVKIGAQSFDEIPVEAKAQKSGLLDVCLKNKVIPLDLAKTNFVKKGDLEISEEIFNSNLIINLPILKVGKMAASENILKVLKKENYLGLKYLSSETEILEKLNKVLPDYLTIADGQNVQRLDKFIRFLGLVLASFNSLNLDRVFAEITMIKNLPEYLKEVKIETIPIIGREIEELKYELEKF